jgi:DNA topoisomerase-3
MIVDRDQVIADFKPETFWQVDATFSVATSADSGESSPTWTGRWFDPTRKAQKGKDKEESDKSERLSAKSDAEAIVAATTGQTGEISSIAKKAKKEAPPLLYDLTSLQRRANQRYGLSAQNTLDIAQAMYEKHKLLTYPRTDARYLTPDQIPTLAPILKGIAAVSVYRPFVDELLSAPLRTGKRIVNAKEVGDHHAIIPTGRSPMSCNLTPDEKRIFDLVSRRLMATLGQEAIFDLTECIVSVEPNTELPETISSPLQFRSKGRICRQIGWQAVDPPGKKHKDKELPHLEEGTTTNTDSCELKEGQTRPPKHHNDASILRSMETAGATLDDKELKRAMRSGGLGTPATRAAILQTLIRREFIERKGKELRALPRGVSLISAVPVDELKSAKLTGRWEARLTKIAEGHEPREGFMSDVGARIQEIVTSIRAAEPPPPEKIARDQGEELGKCPICKEPVRDRKVVYACDTGRSCSFVIFSTIAKRKVSKSAVKKMLKGETTATLKGFKSKKGSEFSAAMKLDEEGKVKFIFEERGARNNRSKNSGNGKAATDPTGSTCPKCNSGRIIRGRKAFGCSRWREGCDHRQPLNNRG